MSGLVVTGLGQVQVLGAVTLSELVRRVRLRMNDNPYEDLHTDTLTADTTDNIMTVADGTKYSKGNLIEWEDYPWERALVDSVSSNNVTLHRAHDGTTVMAHAANSRFLKQPDWSANLIAEAITRVIQTELWPYAWAEGETSLTPNNPTTVWYPLPEDFIDPINVVQLYSTSDSRAYGYGERGGRVFQFKHGLPTALVSTGIGASFPQGFQHSTNLVYVTYRRLVAASGNTTTVTDGLMADTVVWGAITRMLSDRDLTEQADRTPTQRPGTAIRNAGWYRANFENIRSQLQAHLWETSRPMKVWRR